MSDTPAPARHIRLTSHPGQGPAGAPPIRRGAADALERGPIVGTTTNRSQRNVIGTHSGSYGVYRALAVAAGNLTRGHRADLTDTSPTDAFHRMNPGHASGVSTRPAATGLAATYATLSRSSSSVGSTTASYGSAAQTFSH